MSLADTLPNAQTDALSERQSQKSDSAYRTISEVASELDLPQHVLRFWESKFKQISPMKRGGGRRYYRPQDIDLLKRIHYLLHTQGYTIKGVQKLLSKDRQLLNSVPMFDGGNTASVNIDAAMQRQSDSKHQTTNENTTIGETPDMLAPHNTDGHKSVTMSLTMRTDLQLVINRLKSLRAQMAKNI